MGQQYLHCPQPLVIRIDRLVVEMNGELHIVLKALADEQFRALRGRTQALRPAGIAGERQHLAFQPQSERVRRRARGMLHLERRDGDAVQRKRDLLLIFDELEAEAARAVGDVGIESLGRSLEALGDALRPGDDQRTRALPRILGVDEKSRQASEMVAMQMADTHYVDFVGLEAESMHPNQRRDAAIDEEGGAAGTDMERGLQLTAGAKSIPAPYDCKTHDCRTVPLFEPCLSTRRQAPRQCMDGRFSAERQ